MGNLHLLSFSGIVHLKSKKFHAITQAVDFLYKGRSDLSILSFSELDDLLEVADFMQIENLRQKCIEQLWRFIPDENNSMGSVIKSNYFEMFVFEN